MERANDCVQWQQLITDNRVQMFSTTRVTYTSKQAQKSDLWVAVMKDFLLRNIHVHVLHCDRADLVPQILYFLPH